MEMKTVTKTDHPIHIAGRLWTIPTFEMVERPDGSGGVVNGVSRTELTRVHRGIANVICGDPAPLSPDELEFFCDVTETPYMDVAKHLGIAKSTVSKWWTRRDTTLSLLYSRHLKKWFWFKLFGDQFGHFSVLVRMAINDDELLSHLAKYAAHLVPLIRPESSKVPG